MLVPARGTNAGVLPGLMEYTLYLIVSAYMQGASQHDNAVATAHLIRAMAKEHLTVEQCIGVFNGQREMSLKVSGFESMSDAISMAQVTLANFGQECALLVDDKNVAWSITARTVITIGQAERAVTNPAEDGAASYTQFMDGTYLVARERSNVLVHDDRFALAA